jgi:hypothetical protein
MSTEPVHSPVFSSRRILDGSDWIHYVTHDLDDGAWQFHPYSGPTPEEEAVVVALSTIHRIDPSVIELRDLPVGWHAWRDTKGGRWYRAQQ